MQSAASGAVTGSGRERPRFRQDLIAETVEQSGARFIDVMAPEGGDVFRFYEVEYSLACGMDGERDVAGIVRWAQDELGLTPSHQEVRAVISTLADFGFIDNGELAAGVVAPPPDRAEADSGVELGAAGPVVGRAPSLPPAPDFALGAPGTGARFRSTPAPGSEVVLGAPGARSGRPTPSALHSEPDVSLDLSEHNPVRPDDVKEAVRASRVMNAVDVPVDMLELIQDRPTAPASAFDAPTVARIPEVEALAETIRSPDYGRDTRRDREELERRSREDQDDGRDRGAVERRSREDQAVEPPDTRNEIRVGKSPLNRQPAVSRPPVELPPPPAQTERVRPPPAPRTGISPVLIVVLVIAVLGAAVFLAWKYMLDKPAPDAETNAAPPPALKPPPPPPPPPAPAAKIALETPPPEDVKITRNGVIETVLADQSKVREGDIVAKLVGDKPIEAEIAGLTRDQKRLQDAIDAATKRRDNAHNAGNKAAETAAQNEITDREKSLTTKQNLLAARTADLDGFLIHAAIPGVFSPQVKLGQKLQIDTVIGKLQHDPVPTATFKVANTKPYAANASVEVTVGKSGEQRLTCTVADVQPDGVKVTCPGDAALNDGTDVALQVPAATSPSTPEAPPVPAPAGAAAPAAGSAEPGSATPPAMPPTETLSTPPAAGSGEPAGSAAAGSAAAPAAPGSGSGQ
jgi:hypothetical protein